MASNKIEGKGLRTHRDEARELRQARAYAQGVRVAHEFTDPHGMKSIICLCSADDARKLSEFYGWSEVSPVLHESIPIEGVR